jgi:hypothetical protein
MRNSSPRLEGFARVLGMGAFMLLLVTANARAERKIIVRIKLSGACDVLREKSRDLLVVLNGDETTPITPAPRKGHSRTWETNWEDRRGATFPKEPLCASVRLGGGRTYCERAVQGEDYDKNDAVVAEFSFDCDEQDVLQVTIDTHPGIAFSYVRELKRIDNGNGRPDPSECECLEKATTRGKRIVRDVMIPPEKLLVRLGLTTAISDGGGLLLFSADDKSPGVLVVAGKSKLLVNDPFLKDCATDIENGFQFEREDIVQSLIVKNRARPLTDPALDLYEKTFGNLKSVDVTAVK